MSLVRAVIDDLTKNGLGGCFHPQVKVRGEILEPTTTTSPLLTRFLLKGSQKGLPKSHHIMTCLSGWPPAVLMLNLKAGGNRTTDHTCSTTTGGVFVLLYIGYQKKSLISPEKEIGKEFCIRGKTPPPKNKRFCKKRDIRSKRSECCVFVCVDRKSVRSFYVIISREHIASFIIISYSLIFVVVCHWCSPSRFFCRKKGMVRCHISVR